MLQEDRDEELLDERPKKDVELTLGPAMLFGIVCGLILLCGLCFGIGYTSGRRNGARAAAGKEAASGQTLAAQSAGTHKPDAKGTPPTVQAATSNATPQTNPGTPAPSAPSAQNAEPAVHAAMNVQANPPAATNSSSSQIQPALPPGSGSMVQVAAVSHMEDANVLMAALRKRGYAVVSRREADDNLIHVQIGPFANRTEANAMSQRLLSDGYNAVVLP